MNIPIKKTRSSRMVKSGVEVGSSITKVIGATPNMKRYIKGKLTNITISESKYKIDSSQFTNKVFEIDTENLNKINSIIYGGPILGDSLLKTDLGVYLNILIRLNTCDGYPEYVAASLFNGVSPSDEPTCNSLQLKSNEDNKEFTLSVKGVVLKFSNSEYGSTSSIGEWKFK